VHERELEHLARGKTSIRAAAAGFTEASPRVREQPRARKLSRSLNAVVGAVRD
jgi:hypothetical protein